MYCAGIPPDTGASKKHMNPQSAMKTIGTVFALLLSAALGLAADPPADAVPSRMPPGGIPVPPEIRAELEQGVADLGWDMEDVKLAAKARPAMGTLLPDVQIYYNAVRYALQDDLFYKTNDFDAARKLIAEGRERAKDLQLGLSPWTTNSGLVVRGYLSRIDGSVQPYGLVVPPTFKPDEDRKHPLHIWLHGRNDHLSELAFITDRESKFGDFTPPDAFVLHPYGRYCNAFKFAGEADVLEALGSAQARYPVDENRIAMRGFSMGGAGAWHLAVHYPGLWAVASPGAGFVNVAAYQAAALRANPPAPYEPSLWHLYDATDYAANLYDCPVIAYSGEIDPQRAAADLMSKAMTAEGLSLEQVIGPKVAHKWEPHAKQQVEQRIEELVAKGRDPMPLKLNFTTWTLRYNNVRWLTVDGLEKHWEQARVDAEISLPARVELDTANVTGVTISMAPWTCPIAADAQPHVVIDQQVLTVPAPGPDRSWKLSFQKKDSQWALIPAGTPPGSLRKVHGLQGPIDDAFMDAFIMVRPTGRPMNKSIGAWTTNAMEHAVEAWRLQFRGEPRVEDDTAVSDDDIASANLIIWGDPRSNKILERIADKLPIHWTSGGVQMAGNNWPADDHVPVFIYPNPLNPAHYVVINSGFTFAAAARLSNALQVPMLPDYAVIDIAAHRLAAAGFFDEDWNVPDIQ
jgi:predicted esterase